MYSKTMWNKQKYCWQLQSHVWITNFSEENCKTTIFGKSSYFFVVLRFGGSCQEMGGTILWVGKQDDSITLQSVYSMHWWPPLYLKRKSWNLQENCQKYPLKLFWNACTWHVLGDQIFSGQWINLRNGPKPVTNDWIVWYLTFITHVNTNSIVMWETLQNKCRLELCQNSDVPGDLEDSKST